MVSHFFLFSTTWSRGPGRLGTPVDMPIKECTPIHFMKMLSSVKMYGEKTYKNSLKNKTESFELI